MTTTTPTVVVSDVHMTARGARNALHSKDAEALATLIDTLAREPAPLRLVLAGDIFDFLHLDDYAGFDRNLAPERLESILANETNQPILRALRQFGAKANNAIDVMIGNHDPELLLAPVQEVLERSLGRLGSLRYPDREALVPEQPTRPGLQSWPVWGTLAGEAQGGVVIVHGDRWDPDNAIHRANLLNATVPKLPLGSTLVHRVIAPLSTYYPWIIALKPEVPAVLPLLFYLDGKTTAVFLREHLGIPVALLANRVRALARQGPTLSAEEESKSPPPPESHLDALSHALLQGSAADARNPDDLLADILTHSEHGPRPMPVKEVAAPHGIGRVLIRAWLWLVRAAGAKDASLSSAITKSLDGRLTPAAIVAGHTHGPMTHDLEETRYCNSGTWLPVAELPVDATIDSTIARIERGHIAARSPRTFVRVDWPSGLPLVRLGRHCSSRGLLYE